MEAVAQRARKAALDLATSTNEQRCTALRLFRDELKLRKDAIENANAEDMTEASNRADAAPLVKRLDCTGKKFVACLQGIDQIINQKDPLGLVTLATELSEGLRLYRVTCPIGVIAVIFEARPEAGIQIASLAIRTGNVLIMKGGREAHRSNHAIYDALESALTKSQLPRDSVQLVDSRQDVDELLKLDSLIDLVVPRGSKQLVKHIKNNTKIPVLGHADGLCSAYIDEDNDDLDLAINVVVDSKTNYPAACNAIETLIVHEKIAGEFLPRLAAAMKPFNLKFHADFQSLPLLPDDMTTPAMPEDFDTEYLSLDLCVKTVKSIREAVQHINEHGSHHTDVIVTKDTDRANLFLAQVDSSSVFHNCSTRFADGFRYGFGAEVGISTNRIHSRGPVGLEGLVIYKYKLYGRGQTVGAGVCGETKAVTEFSHHKLPITTCPPADAAHVFRPTQ